MLEELQIIPEDADLRTPQALDMLKVKFTTGKNSAMEKSEKKLSVRDDQERNFDGASALGASEGLNRGLKAADDSLSQYVLNSLGPSGTIDQGLTTSINPSKNVTEKNSALGMMDQLGIVPKSSSNNSFFRNALESLSGSRKQESRSKAYEIPRPETDTRDEFQKDSDYFSEEATANSNPIAIAIEKEDRASASPVSVA